MFRHHGILLIQSYSSGSISASAPLLMHIAVIKVSMEIALVNVVLLVA